MVRDGHLYPVIYREGQKIKWKIGMKVFILSRFKSLI